MGRLLVGVYRSIYNDVEHNGQSLLPNSVNNNRFNYSEAKKSWSASHKVGLLQFNMVAMHF